MQATNVPASVEQELIDTIVERIVNSVHPVRIVLFGSAAQGRMGPDSDLDILVVMPDGVHRRQTAQKIYLSLTGVGFATDIVVAVESDVRDFADNPSLVLVPALRDGVELYRAGG